MAWLPQVRQLGKVQEKKNEMSCGPVAEERTASDMVVEASVDVDIQSCDEPAEVAVGAADEASVTRLACVNNADGGGLDASQSGDVADCVGSYSTDECDAGCDPVDSEDEESAHNHMEAVEGVDDCTETVAACRSSYL